MRSIIPSDRGAYFGTFGTTRTKNIEKKIMHVVPTASRSRKSDVLSPNKKEDIEAKKTALSPKAESGNPVAVPR